MTYVVQFSAVLLFALAVIVLVKERKAVSISLASGLLAVALIQVFEHLAGANSYEFFSYRRTVIVIKSLMPVFFLLYGISYRKRSHAEFPHLPSLVLSLLGAAFALSAQVVPLEYFYAPDDAPGDETIPLGLLGYWFYLGLMIFCIAALVNIEAVFASIRGADRWKLKYELLGVGSILGVFIFYFSQGLLYRSVNLALLPVRSGALVIAALLIGYSRLFRGQSQKVAVSRYVFYRSFSLLAVGLYLLALGLVGQLMRSFRISLSRDLMLLVSFASGILFIALVFSEEIRRRIRVLAAKHFYAQKHDYREQWLRLSNTLAACRGIEDVQEATMEAYRRIYGLQFSALYVRRAGPSFVLAAVQGREALPDHLGLSRGLSGYFLETGRVLNPLDGEYTLTAEEAEFCRAAEAWLLVPLMARNNLEAIALLGAQTVPEALTYEDYDLMKIIGRQAALSLNNFRLAEALAEAREMAAVAKVSSFVIHDLKNLAYTFSLMMDNAEEHIEEREFQRDLVRSIRSTVAKMNDLIAKLKAFPEKTALQRERADVARLAQETLDEIRLLKPSIAFEADLPAAEAEVDAAEIRKVALNLLLNACDAVGGAGRVRVRTDRRDGEVRLGVEDSGCGMAEPFVQGHLFKPFRTTKEKGLGIGLYQCKQIVEAHGGRIEVVSREGKGTVFTVVLPASGRGAA